VVVVVEVGGRDQVDGVERLVVTVAMVVEALVHLVHVVDVSQAAGLVQSRGGTGGTWLFESVRNVKQVGVVVGVGAVVGGSGESPRLVTVTSAVPPLSVLVISITRDVAGRTIVHHLLASHPVIVSGPVGLGQGVGPIECSIGWKKFLPRRVGVAEDTPIQAVSGLALSALPATTAQEEDEYDEDQDRSCRHSNDDRQLL